MGKKKKNNVSQPQPEIKEFIRSEKESKKRTVNVDVHGILFSSIFVVVLIAVIICGILVCKQPVATVIIVAVLEALLSFCLCKTPIWLHGVTVIVNIILGFIFKMPLFMVLSAFVYIAGVLAMHYMEEKIKKNI